MLVGVPVFGWRVVVRDIRFGERMSARFFDERGDFTIGPAGVAQLLDLVAYHVDKGRHWEPLLAQAQRIAHMLLRTQGFGKRERDIIGHRMCLSWKLRKGRGASAPRHRNAYAVTASALAFTLDVAIAVNLSSVAYSSSSVSFRIAAISARPSWFAQAISVPYRVIS